MSNVFDHIIVGIQLIQMNAAGKHAVIVPPCEDLPTLVHTRDGELKKKPSRWYHNSNIAQSHPWRRYTDNDAPTRQTS